MRGVHGKGKDKRGANGADTIIQVPLGTEVRRQLKDGEIQFVADIVDETPCPVAFGGRGGWGNTRFVSSTNQEPVLAEKGEDGESVVLFLELKLLADVGLIARPNAGKSTLISRCSAAKPKIAEYPFTTLEPVLAVATSRGKDFVMMEIPGLLEGAHEGVGLGHEFLRHAERARIYVNLLDGLSEDPVGDLNMVNEELRQFNPELAEKPRIVVVNKVDVTEVREIQEELTVALTKAPGVSVAKGSDGCPVPVMFISAVTGEGVEGLLGSIVECLEAYPAQVKSDPAPVPTAVRPRSGRSLDSVRKEGGVFVIESPDLERLAALADTRDRRVLLQLWREMRQRGVARRLADAGIEPGETIRIGRVELEWF